MNFTPSFHDIAHLAHLELLTPKPAESLAFFTNIVGLHESGRAGDYYAQRAAQRANHAQRISGHKEIKFAEAFQQITPVVLKEFR